MKRVLLEAPIYTQSGYGEHSRLVFESICSDENLQIFVNPLAWGQTPWEASMDHNLKQKIDSSLNMLTNYLDQCKSQGQQPSFDIHIHVGIPSEYEKKAPYSVCVTAGIETDRVAPEWLVRTHRGMDKLIVPSEHASLGFTQTSYEMYNKETQQKSLIDCGVPVDVVPYPVKEIEKKDLDFSLSTDFNFLSIALLGPRKNMQNMVQWFVEEFKNESVGLVLKTCGKSGGSIDHEFTKNVLNQSLQNYKDRKCKVYLIHGDLEESEIQSLYQRSDIHAYVSATHGEGYGLPIFESAYHGLPIVAPDWSAHVEFLSAPFKENNKIKNKKLFAKVDYDLAPIPKQAVWKDILVEGSNWCYPKEISFRKQIRKMYKNHGMYKKWAAALKNNIIETHSKQLVLEKMRASILSINPAQESSPAKQEEVLVL